MERPETSITTRVYVRRRLSRADDILLKTLPYSLQIRASLFPKTNTDHLFYKYIDVSRFSPRIYDSLKCDCQGSLS